VAQKVGHGVRLAAPVGAFLSLSEYGAARYKVVAFLFFAVVETQNQSGSCLCFASSACKRPANRACGASPLLATPAHAGVHHSGVASVAGLDSGFRRKDDWDGRRLTWRQRSIIAPLPIASRSIPSGACLQST
jgi:hypothetical protein